MLSERVKTPPDDGGVWTAKKVARVMAAALGVAEVAVQRGWEALRAIGREEAGRHPDAVIEVFAIDEHRIGLKPVLRRVWGPCGQRPIAVGHHRFE